MPTMQKRTRCGRTRTYLVKCEKLKDLYMNYSILEYEELFNSNITIERLKQIVKFMEELNLKQ